MARETYNLRQELIQLKYDFNLLQKIDCSRIENERYARFIEDGEPLPSDVFRRTSTDGKNTDEFYTVRENDLTDNEKKEYYNLKQLDLLSSIKSFTLITAGMSAASAIIIILMFFMNL